jgi:hypothetical protein
MVGFDIINAEPSGSATILFVCLLVRWVGGWVGR